MLALCGATPHAWSELSWQWRFGGQGVVASGTFATEDKPDADGFYHIVRITGTANHARITRLQKTGTAIPGNAGYPVDNLIREKPPQLTSHGFGFATSDRDFHNPFFKSGYLDYISAPPYPEGKGSEPAIQFSASPTRRTESR